MALDVIQFVDAITGAPTVRLDLNDDVTWGLTYGGTDLSPPQLKYAEVNTLLADGELRPASAYRNRTVKLGLELKTTTVDGQAVELQKLWQQLDRPNVIRWQPAGAGEPVFFRTLRSSNTRVIEMPGDGKFRLVNVEVDAEPFAYGLRQTLPPVVVYDDPAEGTTLNANPFFETNVASWTVTGGTIARSTAQFHEGVASMLLTPDGVTAAARAMSEQVNATAGASLRFSPWVRCAVARSIDANINWFTAAGVFISSSTLSLAVAANTWAQIDLTAIAPPTTGKATGQVSETGTPPVGHTLHVDEARLRPAGGAGGMCLDVAGVRGDVDTPALIKVDGSLTVQSVFATRRRGTPSAAPFVLQAETATITDPGNTSLGANDPAMSGGGSNRLTTSFAASSVAAVFNVPAWPLVPSPDARGRYRVFGRHRVNGGTTTVDVQLIVSSGTGFIANDAATLSGAVTPNLVDLGEVTIPLGHDPVYDGYSGTELAAVGIDFTLWATRTAGLGTLDTDFLLFVPADDQFAIIEYDNSSDLIWDGPNGAAYMVDGSGRIKTGYIPKIQGEHALQLKPAQTNRIYFLRTVLLPPAGGAHSLTASTTLTVSYWPAYLYVAGPTT